MLVTISSSINKTDVQSLTTQNGTTGNNENTTIGTNANGTISNNANSTVDVPQSTTNQTNRTNNATQNAIGLEGGSSNQVSTSKPGGKNIHELSRALGKNFTLDTNNANDVSSVNHPPIAMDQSVIVYTNKATGIVLRGTDPDKDPVKFEIASDPLKGVLVGFNKETGAVTYIPNPASPGEDSFTFKVIDIHNAESDVARVSETIVLIPTVGSDRGVGTDVGTSHQSLNSAPIANDDKLKIDQKKQTAIVLQGTDVDHDKLTYSIVQGPSHGKLIAFDPSTGKLSYRANDNFVGQDVFTFKAKDQKGLSSNAAKVEIMVNGGVKGHSNIHVDPPSLEKAITDETSGNNVSFARNSNPSVNAGPDRVVYAGTKDIILKGIATDLDDDLLTYSWKQTGGPIVDLNSPNSAKSTFNVPVEVDDKVFRFVLLVSDGRGGHDTDEVKISIRDKDVPTDQPFQNQIQRRAIINQTSQVHR